MILSYGCATQTRDVVDQPIKLQEKQAETYLANGNYAAAAEEFLALAENNKKQSEKYQLRAAHAYILDNQIQSAQLILDKIPPENLDPVQQVEKNILLAKIAIFSEDALLALHTLDFTLTGNLPDNLRAEYYSALAIALQMDQ